MPVSNWLGCIPSSTLLSLLFPYYLSDLTTSDSNLDARLLRQLNRMKEVVKVRSEDDNKIFESFGRNTVKIRMEIGQESHHWDILQDLVAVGKRDGYACCSVDDAMFYEVRYSEEAGSRISAESGDLPFSRLGVQCLQDFRFTLEDKQG